MINKSLMRTEQDIYIEQDRFCAAYPFRDRSLSPKMKAWKSAIKVSVTTRRYPVYSSEIENRRDAVNFWELQLERLGEKYITTEQSQEQFILDVFELQDTINNSEYARCFNNSHIRVGQCQKSLSVYLKWMWCQHQLAAVPLVCPIDRQVLNACRRVLLRDNDYTDQELTDTYTAWSNLDDRDLYTRLVKITLKVTKLEKEQSPAVWELFAFRVPER